MSQQDTLAEPDVIDLTDIVQQPVHKPATGTTNFNENLADLNEDNAHHELDSLLSDLGGREKALAENKNSFDSVLQNAVEEPKTKDTVGELIDNLNPPPNSTPVEQENKNPENLDNLLDTLFKSPAAANIASTLDAKQSDEQAVITEQPEPVVKKAVAVKENRMIRSPTHPRADSILNSNTPARPDAILKPTAPVKENFGELDDLLDTLDEHEHHAQKESDELETSPLPEASPEDIAESTPERQQEDVQEAPSEITATTKSFETLDDLLNSLDEPETTPKPIQQPDNAMNTVPTQEIVKPASIPESETSEGLNPLDELLDNLDQGVIDPSIAPDVPHISPELKDNEHNPAPQTEDCHTIDDLLDGIEKGNLPIPDVSERKQVTSSQSTEVPLDVKAVEEEPLPEPKVIQPAPKPVSHTTDIALDNILDDLTTQSSLESPASVDDKAEIDAILNEALLPDEKVETRQTLDLPLEEKESPTKTTDLPVDSSDTPSPLEDDGAEDFPPDEVLKGIENLTDEGLPDVLPDIPFEEKIPHPEDESRFSGIEQSLQELTDHLSTLEELQHLEHDLEESVQDITERLNKVEEKQKNDAHEEVPSEITDRINLLEMSREENTASLNTRLTQLDSVLSVAQDLRENMRDIEKRLTHLECRDPTAAESEERKLLADRINKMEAGQALSPLMVEAIYRKVEENFKERFEADLISRIQEQLEKNIPDLIFDKMVDRINEKIGVIVANKTAEMILVKLEKKFADAQVENRLTALENRPIAQDIDLATISTNVLNQIRSEIDRISAHSASRILREEIAALIQSVH